MGEVAACRRRATPGICEGLLPRALRYTEPSARLDVDSLVTLLWKVEAFPSKVN